MFKSIDDYLIDTILSPLCVKYGRHPLAVSEFFLAGYVAMLLVSVLVSAMVSGFSFLFLLVILPFFRTRSLVNKCESLRKVGAQADKKEESFRKMYYFSRIFHMVVLPVVTYFVIASTIPTLLVLIGFWLYWIGLYLLACTIPVVAVSTEDVDLTDLP